MDLLFFKYILTDIKRTDDSGNFKEILNCLS